MKGTEKMNKKNWKLDEEEKELLGSYNKGEWKSTGEDLDKYKQAAKQTFAKTHRINLRISERDFRGIQIKAREEGMPYQTLVSSLVHKYLAGKIKEIQ